MTVGQAVTGPGIPAGAYIANLISSTQFYINVTATSAGTSTLNFAAANYNAVNLSLNSSQFTLASGTETLTVSNNGDNTNTGAGTGTTLTLTGTLGGPGTVSLISAGTGTLP